MYSIWFTLQGKEPISDRESPEKKCKVLKTYTYFITRKNNQRTFEMNIHVVSFPFPCTALKAGQCFSPGLSKQEQNTAKFHNRDHIQTKNPPFFTDSAISAEKFTAKI